MRRFEAMRPRLYMKGKSVRFEVVALDKCGRFLLNIMIGQ